MGVTWLCSGNVEPDEDLHVPRMSLLEIDEEGTPFTSEEEVPAIRVRVRELRVRGHFKFNLGSPPSSHDFVAGLRSFSELKS